MKKILLLLLTVLPLAVFSQSITITQPNGAEILYPCQAYTISWTTVGSVSGNYDIDYSLDGGTIWASITTNYLSPSKTYSWTVPNVQSGTVLIRVKDSQNGSIVDQSNAFFSINVPVTVTAPNGGETFTPLTTTNITWNAQGTSNTYNIAYSINGGSSWIGIVSGYNSPGGSYTWTIPNNPSTNCLVRVQDAVSACMQDVSNASFTITPLTPLMTYPNGGEQLNVGQTINITWDQNTFYNTVRLEYSINNGSSWTTIAANATNDGSESWTIPYLPLNQAYTQCLVRVSNSVTPALNDVSNVTFTIRKPLTLTVPNGGQTWTGCDTYNITSTLNATGLNNWSIFYSLNNGSSWNTIVSNTSIPSYNWTVPNTLNSTQALIRVVNNTQPQYADTSNAVFTLSPSNDITVVSPNGGQVFTPGQQVLITWTNTANVSGLYNISGIVSGITGNNYLWTVPNSPTTTYQIQVSDANNSCKRDLSDSNITILPLAPKVTYPNGGEQFNVGQDVIITWDTETYYSSNVRIEYSSNNGLTWNLLSSSTTKSWGSFTWTVPQVPLNQAYTQYLVKVSEYDNLLRSDVSNATFSTRKPYTLLYPNGGQTFVGCGSINIDGTSNVGGSSSNNTWRYQYSVDGGSTWSTVISAVAGPDYPWSLPNTITSTQMLIKGNNTTFPQYADTSNAVFTIAPTNDITVTYPNGGQVFTPGQQVLITWTNTAGVSGLFNISGIASNITGNSYLWTVPNSPTTTYQVQVSDANNSCKRDLSDSNITILPLNPKVTYPNGGEQFNVGQDVIITWDTETYYSSNVRIEYSSNNGLTWNLLSSSTTKSWGSFTWTVPQVPLNQVYSQYLVKVSEADNLLRSDVSNATFSTRKPYTLLYPNGGQTFVGCGAINIDGTSNVGGSSSNNTWRYQYSVDGGTTWSTVISAVAGPDYPWSLPNTITSTQMLIKGNNTTFPQYADTSNAVFTIAPTNDITVTYPNGGQVFTPGQQVLITWTNTAGVSGLFNISGIASNITGNSYLWTVPNSPTTTYQVQVSDANNSCKRDLSDSNITILPLAPKVTYPNGGEQFNVGQDVIITWDTETYYSSQVRIEYSSNGGATWNLLSSGTTKSWGSFTWTVPQVPLNQVYSQYLVKVSEADNLLRSDVSNATFSTRKPYTLLYPNGGQTFVGCGAINIDGTSNVGGSSSNNTWRYQYSVDGGTTWNTVISAVAGPDYPWSLPNTITSTQMLIKGNNTTFPQYADTSNAVFTIAPTNDITVTYPNGGQVFTPGQQVLITWTNTAGVSGLFNISGIASNITGNSYLWTVPNSPTTTYQVQVSDANNSCKRDLSDSNITILPLNPKVTYPNGGEQFNVGQDVIITWDTETYYSSQVRIEYSSNGGATWNLLSSGTTKSWGSFTWTVPQVPLNQVYSQYLVKVSEADNLLRSDVSDATFSTRKPYTLIAPNGGQTYAGCGAINIDGTSNVGGSSSNNTWRYQYSIDGGSTWSTVISAVAGPDYPWSLPNTITSSQVLIKGNNTTFPQYADTSNTVFTIGATNDITVTYPNGGEVFAPGQQVLITWTNTANVSGLFTISGIASGITGNSYLWTVPNSPTTTGTITVMDANNTCKRDASDAPHTITQLPAKMTAPNGGQVIYYGQSYDITWNTNTYYTDIRIDFSTDNGTSWIPVSTSENNDGIYSWTSRPNIYSTQCLVKVSSNSDLGHYDVSDAVFTIKPAVTILTPNGGENLGGCTVTSLSFERSPVYSTFSLEYSENGGTTWTTISSNFSASGNPSIYNWNLPNNPTTQGMVRVTPTTLGAPFADVSGSTFTVIKPVTIIQPNYGGSLQVGSTYNIKWQSDGISNFYDIFYSINGGTTWVPIAANYATSTNTYAWTVPNAPSNNCLIRVRDAINTCKEDISDVPFTITGSAPLITVMSPNGQETLSGCSVKNIQWNANASVTSVNIDYTLNGGSTWTNIVSNHTGGSGYNWTVPNVNTALGLIRVVSFNNNTVFDQSDALFSIQKSSVQIVAPTVNDTTICNGQQVQLLATGGNGTFTWTGAGLNNANIANPIATPTVTTAYVVTSTSGSCSLKDTVTVHVNTNPALVAGVSVGVNPGTVLCSNQTGSVVFTATPTNGGSSPVYQWKKNGVNVGSNSPTYAPVSINNTDQVTVTLTSNLACVSGNPVTSATTTMSVTPTVVPSVSIGVSPNSTICNGATVQFTATPVNAGGSPVYQWRVNGLNVGNNSNTYSSNSLANGDVVTVELQSSATCANPASVTASGITVTVTGAPAQPGAINGAASTCTGNTVAYSVNPVAGATSYIWTLPAGWSGSSNNNAISTGTGTVGGTISVSASNACGTSNATTMNVSINASPTAAHAGNNAQVCGTSTVLNGNTPSIGTGNWTVLSGTGTLSDPSLPNPVASNLSIGNNAFVWSIQSGGCQASTDTVFIQRFGAPTVANAGNNINICEGTNSISLQGNVPTAGTGQWTLVSGTANIASPADANSLLSNLSEGVHVLQWTISNGTCTASSDQVTVNVNPAPNVQANALPVSICQGTSTVLTASGANTYVWQPGNLTGNNVVVTPNSTSIYTVTGTDANGCTSTANVTVNVTNAIPVQLSATDTVICQGQVITLQASGAGNYTWQPGNLTGNSIVVNPSATTTYSVTGNQGGCSGTANLTIIVQNNPSVNITGNDSICPGQSTTLTASGGTSYVWQPGNLTGNSITVSPTGTSTYTVTATHAGGCSATAQTTVHVLSVPSVNVSPNTTVCAGQPTTLNASGATSYVWLPGNQTGASITVAPNSTTTYQVIGSNALGCSSTANVTVSVNTPPNITVSAPQTSICQGSSVTLTANNGTSYVWQPGNLTGNSITVSPTAATVYTVTGTGVNGCQNTATLTIQVQSLPNLQATAANSPICAGTSTSLNATGANSYTWMPGNLTGSSVTVTPSSTTTYTVTGTSNGCSTTQNVTVQVLNNTGGITLTANDTSICVGESVTLNAGGGSNYLWLDNNSTGNLHVVSPTSTTAYTVTGTTPSGCPASASIVIHVNTLPNVSANAVTNNVCSGSAVTLNANGANSYVWQPGNLTGNSVVVHPNTTTIYTVTGTNANGCSSTAMVTVNVIATPNVGASSPNTTLCAGGSTTLTANGATQYLWLPVNQNASIISVTPSATTTYQVIGSTGACSDTAFITVQVLSAPNVSINPSATTVCAGGSVTLTGNGATQYTWQPGNLTGNSIVVNPTATTVYTVTGSTGNGCSNTATVTIAVNALPTVGAGATQTSICQGASTTLNASGAGSYVWMPGNLSGSSVTVSPTATTVYTVTGTSNGCSNTATVTVAVNTTPSVNATSNDFTLCVGESANLSANGATNYVWLPGNQTGSSITVSPTTTTTYQVIGSNGTCSDTGSVTLTVNSLPTVDVDANTMTICSGSNANLSASGANSYVWMPGNLTGPGITVNPATTTSYTVTGTNANGCSNSASLTISVVASPSLTINSSNTDICPGDAVTLSVTGSGTYTWQPGNLSGNSIVVNPSNTTTYSVTGTNANSCNSNANQVITVHALPVVSFGPVADVCSLTPSFALTQGVPTGGTYTGTGVTGGAFDPGVGIGSYTLTYTYTDGNGCTNSAPQNVEVYTCAGVDEVESLEKAVLLYPNPTPDEVYIVTQNYPIDRVELYDSRGALIAIPSMKMDNGNIRFSLIHLSDGLYTVRIYSGDTVAVKKVIKNR